MPLMCIFGNVVCSYIACIIISIYQQSSYRAFLLQ